MSIVQHELDNLIIIKKNHKKKLKKVLKEMKEVFGEKIYSKKRVFIIRILDEDYF